MKGHSATAAPTPAKACAAITIKSRRLGSSAVPVAKLASLLPLSQAASHPAAAAAAPKAQPRQDAVTAQHPRSLQSRLTVRGLEIRQVPAIKSRQLSPPVKSAAKFR